MRPFVASLGISLCFIMGMSASVAAVDCAARPSWCAAGFECRPIACAQRTAIALERLGSELIAARADRPRWFRPFLEGGATWSPVDQATGVYAEGGALLWRRLSISGQVTDDDVRARVGWRREW